MTQRDRDRLVALKQAHKRQITQKQAAEQLVFLEGDIITTWRHDCCQ